MNEDEGLNGTLRCGGECQHMIADNFKRLLDLERTNHATLLDLVNMKSDVKQIANTLGAIRNDNKTLAAALMDDKKTWGRVFMASILLGSISILIVTVATLNTRATFSGAGMRAEIGQRNQ